MATKLDAAEAAFEAASIKTETKPAPVAAKVEEAPAKVEAAKPATTETVKAAPAKAAVAKKAAPAKKAATKKVAAKKPAAKKAPVKAAARAAAKPAAKTTTATTKTVRAAVAKPTAAAKKGFASMKTMTDTFKKQADEAKAQAEAMFGDLGTRTRAAVEKGQELAGDVVEFHKGNFEAIVESGKIAAKHLQALGQESLTFGRNTFQEQTAALRGYTSVKSPTEFFQLYADNTKKLFESYVAQGSKTTEMVVKMANESAQPISNRVALAVSKLKSAA